MTGKEFYNVVAFEAAAAAIGRAGYTALTPFESNNIAWRRHFGRDFNPRLDICEYGDQIMAEMVAEDLRTMCSADAIALLPGWEESRGAKAELLLAQNLGMGVYDAITLAPLAVRVRAVIDRG